MSKQDIPYLQSLLCQALGTSITFQHIRPLKRTPVYTTALVETEKRRFFIKYGPAKAYDLLAAEADGLQAIADTDSFKTPDIQALSRTESSGLLVLEYLDLQPLSSAEEGSLFAEKLTQLHQFHSERFGWHQDNYLGLSSQHNAWQINWARFFITSRLTPQLQKAYQQGYRTPLHTLAERILPRAPALFLDYRIQPSLLHGDLWYGNTGVTTDGQLAVFDPACYYGDTEAELALAELFGGFPSSFYAGYFRLNPPAPGSEYRKLLYRLYHILNHLNLFGSTYLREAETLLKKLDQILI